MRNELLAWFAREGLVLMSASVLPADEGEDEVKITIKAPVVLLSRNVADVRECPDPVLFGYPESSLDMMTLEDMNQFVYSWFERAIQAGRARCFVCNRELALDDEKPWDAVFITTEMYCWLVVHFDCKRYLTRDLKGRNPFEVSTDPPELFDLHLDT